TTTKVLRRISAGRCSSASARLSGGSTAESLRKSKHGGDALSSSLRKSERTKFERFKKPYGSSGCRRPGGGTQGQRTHATRPCCACRPAAFRDRHDRERAAPGD